MDALQEKLNPLRPVAFVAGIIQIAVILVLIPFKHIADKKENAFDSRHLR